MMRPSTDRAALKVLQHGYDELLLWMERIGDGWHVDSCSQIDACRCAQVIARMVLDGLPISGRYMVPGHTS